MSAETEPTVTPAAYLVDWQAIQRTFVSEDPEPTIQSLSEKYGVDEKTLSKRIKTQNWKRRRSEFKSIINSRVSEALVQTLVENTITCLEDIRRRDLEIADKLYRKVATWLNVPDKVVQLRDKQDNPIMNKDGTPATYTVPALPPKELAPLAQAAMAAQRIAMTAMGMAPDGTATLEHERRADAAQASQVLLTQMVQLRQDAKDLKDDAT